MWRSYHTVWAVLLFGWITNYMVRVGISPVLVPIKEEFGLTHAQAGLLAAIFFYAYTAMQLPAGHLGDRIGRRRVLAVGAFCWSLFSLASGFANSFLQLALCRFMTGLGEGSYFGNDRPIIAAYTPKERMGFGQGISFTGLGIGMCLGILLSGVISDAWGWRFVFYLFSVPSLAAGFLILKMIQEPPRATQQKDQKVSYGPAFRNPDLWMLYLGGIAPIYTLWVIGTWAPAMFMEIGVEKLATSSIYASLMGIAAIPGLILTGRFSDWVVRHGIGRKGVVVLEFLILAVLMGLMGYAIRVQAPIWVFALCTFWAGFFIWGMWSPIFSLVSEIAPQRILGTTFGLMNAVNFVGALVAPWLTGWIKDVTGSFAWGAYSAGMFMVLGAVIVLCIRPAFRFGREVFVLEA